MLTYQNIMSIVPGCEFAISKARPLPPRTAVLLWRRLTRGSVLECEGPPMSADSLEMLFREFCLPTMAARFGEMMQSAEA